MKLFRLLHHCWHRVKNTTNAKKRPSLKDRDLVPIIQQETDFPLIYLFENWSIMLNLLHMWNFSTFSSWMQRYGQKIKKHPHNAFPLCDPLIFLSKNRALSHLQPYRTLTSCKKVEKLMDGLWDIQRLTDQQTADRTPSGKPGVENAYDKSSKSWLHFCANLLQKLHLLESYV